MKFRILKKFKLANPDPSKTPWSFEQDEIVDVCDVDVCDKEYLAKFLLSIGAADEISDSTAKEFEETPEKAKAISPDRNKMITPEYNKVIKKKKSKK